MRSRPVPLEKRVFVHRAYRSWRAQRGDLHVAGQLSAARDQPAGTPERFVHATPSSQDYRDPTVQARSLGQSPRAAQSSASSGLSRFELREFGFPLFNSREINSVRPPPGGYGVEVVRSRLGRFGKYEVYRSASCVAPKATEIQNRFASMKRRVPAKAIKPGRFQRRCLYQRCCRIVWATTAALHRCLSSALLLKAARGCDTAGWSWH